MDLLLSDHSPNPTGEYITSSLLLLIQFPHELSSRQELLVQLVVPLFCKYFIFKLPGYNGVLPSKIMLLSPGIYVVLPDRWSMITGSAVLK